MALGWARRRGTLVREVMGRERGAQGKAAAGGRPLAGEKRWRSVNRGGPVVSISPEPALSNSRSMGGKPGLVPVFIHRDFGGDPNPTHSVPQPAHTTPGGRRP